MRPPKVTLKMIAFYSRQATNQSCSKRNFFSESLKWMLVSCVLGWGTAACASEGSDVYKQVCAACHTAGVPGTPEAPKLGSRSDPKFSADWNRRLFAGREGLLRSVLNGKGGMPPKGGDASLSDGQVEAALDYMLSIIENGL